MNNNQSRNVLDNLAVASPCTISWDSMVGDNRERNCNGCKKTVYNISDMTKAEAERFLRDNTSAECVKFARRFDGTIVTDDCPRALRVVRDRCKMAAKIVFGMFAFCMSLPAAFTQSLHNQSPMLMVPRNARYSLYFRELSNPSTVSQQINTSYLGEKVYIPRSDSDEASENQSNQKPTAEPTASVSARIVTKERNTPKGKVVLVDANENENVIRSQRVHLKDSPLPSETTEELNKFVDTRVARYYEHARKAISNNNSRLAKAYLIRSLQLHDQQEHGDPIFRKMIVAELQNLESASEKTQSTPTQKSQSEKDSSEQSDTTKP